VTGTRLSRALLAAAATLALTAGVVTVGSAPGAAAGTCTPSSAEPTVTLTNHTVALGGVLRFTGTGWCHPSDGGSRVAVKLDLGAYSHLDTSVHTNRSVWAIVDASATDGTFTAQLTLPDGTAGTSTPVFPLGAHSLQLLSGSLKSGDTVRTLASAPFTVVEPGAVVPDEPSWPHATVSTAGATAWVADDLPAGDGQTMRIAGHGWTHPAGGGSTIAIKLNRDPDGAQYVRTGAAVIEGDATIWALVRSTDGTFETTLDLPAGLTAGQYLTVSLASGKFASGDTQRTVTTAPLTVGGQPWVADDGGDDDPTCTPTETSPNVRLATTSVAFGGVVRLTGSGWCNPAGGGSRIGVKIDDGSYSHLDDTLHANRTIWAIIDAADTDGTFDVDLRLPDGTRATSDPALPRGEHTLRLLSGTLAPGDTVRTLESEPFVVGRYRPNGTPDPLDASRDLRSGNRHGATARITGDRLRVRLPETAIGTWTFVSVYSPDGSPRYPWTRWFRLGDGHLVELSLRSAGLTGRGRVVVQSGEPGHVGEVLGWARAQFGTTVQAGETSSDAGNRTPTAPTAIPGDAISAPSAPAPQALPTAPGPPYAAFADLDPADHGSVTSNVEDGVLTVRIGVAEPGDPVYLHVYAPDLLAPVGWATVDGRRRVRLDLRAVGAAYVGVTVQSAAGRLLGWTPVALGPADDSEPDAVPSTIEEPAQIVTVPVASPSWLGPTDGLLLATGALVLAAASLLTSRRRPAVHHS